MAELKPCPFCGEEASLGYGFDCYYAYCINCHAEIKLEGRAEAIEAWNTRVGDRCTDCLVDRMLDDGR